MIEAQLHNNQSGVEGTKFCSASKMPRLNGNLFTATGRNLGLGQDAFRTSWSMGKSDLIKKKDILL